MVFAQKSPAKPVVLITLAHPDDETMMGATLIKLKEQGARLFVVYVTQGEGGKIVELQPDGSRKLIPINPQRLAQVRSQEMRLAAQKYGIENYIQLGQPDVPLRDAVTQLPSRNGKSFLESRIWDVEKIKIEIKNLAEQIKPDVVITMSLDNGTHAHHKAVRFLTEELFLKGQLSGAQSLLAIDEEHWAQNSEREERKWLSQFDPNQKNLQGKLYSHKAFEAAQMHVSQLPGHTGPLGHIETLYGVAGKGVELTPSQCRGRFL